MLADDIKARLEAEVAVFAGRVSEAADLAALMQEGHLPQATPAAFVVPTGLRPRDGGEVATGVFRQVLDDNFAIVIVVRSPSDLTGKKALPKIDELVSATINALAGWATADALGVFRVTRGNLLSLTGGAVIYQIDFSIETQVRITP